MQELVAQVMSYVWGVWRFRWTALLFAWLVAIVGWVYVWRLPEAYVASARIYVDTNSVLRPLLRGLAITPNISDRISMMSRTLLSRPNMEKLARMTDLDLTATTEKEKEALIKRLQQSIQLSGSRANASLYSIRVKDRNRETARRVTQSLITVFIESSLNDKRADNSGAQSFLDEQIADYEERMIEAESRLAVFKQQNVDVLPGGGGGDYYSRLEATRNNLKRAQLELEEMENRRSELKRQLDGEVPLGEDGAMFLTPLDQRIQGMRMRMDELLMRYTDKHPAVRQLTGLIEELEAEKEQELKQLKEMGGGAAAAGLSTSPVYQGMRSMLAETEAKVAELKVRVAEYQRRSEELNAKVMQIPEIEAQLKQLDRDYGVISRQHQTMLGRRESARLSKDVEDNASDVSFRVIDPPFVPLRPNEPNKLLLNGMVTVLALGAGVGLAFLFSLLSPMITDSRMLAAVTGLPLLGTVTYGKADRERRRDNWRLAGFVGSCAVFVVAGAGVALAPVYLL